MINAFHFIEKKVTLLEIFLYGALLLSLFAVSGKQFAMKKCGAIAPGVFNSACINLMRAVICMAVSVVIWLAAGGGAANALGHVCIALGGIGTAFNLLAWILSSRLVSLVLLETVTTVATMVVPMLLAPILYQGERVGLLPWLGCVLILASLFCFMGKGEEKKEGTPLSKLLTVGLCAVSAGLATICKKYYTFYVESAGNGSSEYYTMMSFAVVLLTMLVLFAVFYGKEKKEKGKVALPYPRVWVFILIAAVCLYVAELFMVYASALPSAIYYPLNRGLSTVFTFLLDVIVFKDKVTSKKLVGLIMVCAAIVLVNL